MNIRKIVFLQSKKKLFLNKKVIKIKIRPWSNKIAKLGLFLEPMPMEFLNNVL